MHAFACTIFDTLKGIINVVLCFVVDSEEEAKKKIYNVSCERYFGFGCEIDEETSNKLEGLCISYSHNLAVNYISVGGFKFFFSCYVLSFILCRSAWCSVCSSRFLC